MAGRHAGLDGPGGDRIGSDSAASQFDGHHPRHRDHAALGCGIGTATDTAEERRMRRNVDDAPVSAGHSRGGGARAEKGGSQIDIDHRLPRRERGVGKRRARGHARCIDQDVEPFSRHQCGIAQPFGGREVGEIDDHCVRASAAGRDAGSDRVSAGSISVGDDDRCAPRSQSLRDRAADAARSAGDQRACSREFFRCVEAHRCE